MIEVEHLKGTYDPRHSGCYLLASWGNCGFLVPMEPENHDNAGILVDISNQRDARIAGYDVHENSLAVRRIGYLPETPPLYAEMTVEDSVFCGAD